MSNTFDLTKPPIVAYAYYREDKDEEDDEPFILCLECNRKYLVPPTSSKANIRDTTVYGNEVPHIECNACNKQVTS